MKDQVVHDRWRQLGFENLLPEEQDYIMIWWLVAGVSNGTFAEYFSNETGDHALQALNGLKKCGATESSRLLQEAIDLFLPFGGYTSDWSLRNHRLDELESRLRGQAEDAIQDVSNAFLGSGEPMLDLALKRVKESYEREGIS